MHAELLPTPMIPFPKGAAPRSGGVHLSGLIRRMAFEYGFLDKKWLDAETLDNLKLVEVSGNEEAWWAGLDEDSRIRMSIGLAWEEWYLPQIPNVVHQPGEMELDGIFMTPDGVSIDYVMSGVGKVASGRWEMVLHEVKTTSKSTKTVGDLNIFNPKNWMWLTQIACYMKASGARFGYLHSLHLYGDYTRPYRPQLLIWFLEFEQCELDNIWDRVRIYRDEKAAAGLLV